jgi:DNA mismatch endonuclease (patch repair protein)
VRRNKERDVRVTTECRKAGWRVVRLWEHEVLKNPARACDKVRQTLSRAGGRLLERGVTARRGRRATSGERRVAIRRGGRA